MMLRSGSGSGHFAATMAEPSGKFGVVNVSLDLDDEKEPQLPGNGNNNEDTFSDKNNYSSSAAFEMKMSKCPKGNVEPTRLTWEDLSYTVDINKWSFANCSLSRKKVTKSILHPQRGEVVSGQLIGIIGPSGAGKSTLLNCLTGRYREGLSGRVYVTCPGLGSKERKLLNVSVIPQRDNLFDQFTVKETLVFASKVKNGHAFDHEAEALKVMKYLNLESCAKNYMKKCSGGQVKRVCIGVELVARPDILVLDEPTTGLDSSTAFQCVSILRKLVDVKENPPAILATIHQPSSKILKQFHQIYLLSKTGRCLYFGPPSGLKEHFHKCGLECPNDYNPADFAIETAYGDYGEEVFEALELANYPELGSKTLSVNGLNGLNGTHGSAAKNGIHGTNGRYLPRDVESSDTSNHIVSTSENRIKITTIIKNMKQQKFPFVYHLYLLLVRNWYKIGRDPGQLYLRLFQNIAIGLMVSYLWNPDIGSEDGCWADFLNTKSENVTDAKNVYLTKISRINANSALLFSFLIYVVMVSVMSTVLSFPTETCVIIKEMKNNWYSCATYYWAKFLAELPILFLTIFVLASIIYPLTGQIPVLWRFGVVYLVTCLMGEVCQTIGMLFGTIFADDLISACFSSVASGFPPILFGGFVVQYAQIRWFLKPFAYLSYLRYAFESLVVTVYGFDRCPQKIASNFVEKISSATNPVALIGTLVQNFNLTAKDAQTFSVLLNVEPKCVEGVINGTIDYFGLNSGGSLNDPSATTDDYDDYDNGTMATPHSMAKGGEATKFEESSYVLSYYSVKEDILLPNILTLLSMIVILKVLTYYILQRKARL